MVLIGLSWKEVFGICVLCGIRVFLISGLRCLVYFGKCSVSRL